MTGKEARKLLPVSHIFIDLFLDEVYIEDLKTERELKEVYATWFEYNKDKVLERRIYE